MNIFDLMTSYKSDWKEVKSRKFTEEEQKCVTSATVVPSNYGKSVCFLMATGDKKYLPLEPIANCNLGDTIDMASVEIVKLVYEGNNPDQKVKEVLRVRILDKVKEVVASFENPFGF